MKFRLFGLLLGAGILICLAVPGFATGVAPTRIAQPVGTFRQLVTPGRGISRSARMVRSPLAGPTPSGCSSNGSPYFVGISGASDVASGGNDEQGYAGVVAGDGNEACDGYSGIVAGSGNVIGGNDNGHSANSIIGGGSGNQIDNANTAFIGVGTDNSISSGFVYGTGNRSAVVAGANNAITSPWSFIGGGYDNSVAPSTLTTDEAYGQSAFVGTGYENVVSGNYSGIVSVQSNAVNSDNSTVVGGQGNVIKVSSSGSAVSANSVIAGGVSNTIATTSSATSGQSAFIGAERQYRYGELALEAGK